jgi:hypothetical protein
MKSSITIPCSSCGKQINLEISGSQLPESAHCSTCPALIYLVAPLGNIVTGLMMERAKRELANEDTTIAIFLSVVAVEGEMAYLFFKWKAIDSGKVIRTQDDLDKWEDDWNNMRSIGKRLDDLSRFLTSTDFDKFALQNKAMLMPVLDGFNPATSIKKFFQEQLFETRNRIVHYGEIDFDKKNGDRCFSLALAMIHLLQAMDRERIKKMDEAHKKARESIPANNI